MCGRFTSLLSPELLSVIYGVQSPSALEPRYNIAPTQDVLAVGQGTSGDRDLSSVRWGLVPHWAKDQSIGSKMINARSETVHEKPAFRQAIRSRRCIVPASGFFEWAATPDGKLPHYICTRDGSPFSFAGIRESWEAPDGHELVTCAILTTAANDMMATIHDRMPVILQQTDFDLWLDNTMNDPLKLQRLYQPYPAELMTSWPVSSFVNSPRNDSPACIEPVTA
jgi:putative SOS response-associated peptidase YedK